MARKYRVPALERAIAILELIAASDKEYTITELHQELDIPKATVFSILNVLEDNDMLQKNENGGYTIGVKLYQLGMAYISKIDIIKIARPHLEKLMQETGFTVHLGVLDDGEILYVDKVEPDSFIKFSTFPGLRSPIHINSLGKAIAAFIKEEELDQIIAERGLGRYTPQTITDAREFKKALERVRLRGYAVEDEEGEVGVRCIGAPVFSHKGKMHVVAAVSIAGHTSKLVSEGFTVYGERVKATAEAISKELGYGEDKSKISIK